MSQQGQQSRQFRALQAVSLLFKWGAFVIWAIAIAIIPILFVTGLLNDNMTHIAQAAYAALLYAPIVSIPLAIYGFIAYVFSQVIGLFLSMHDHLQTLRNLQVQSNQELLEELKRTNGLLQVQFKRTTAILEQHHRRVAHLEEERNT